MNAPSARPTGASAAVFTLSDVIAASARAGLRLQRADGSLPPGHNGPHQDEETPVRNTGHWMMTWLHAFRHTGDTVFRSAAERAADYLMRPEHRPGGHTFHHRSRPGKDKCNGVMGPAFSLESLVAGGVGLHRQDMLDLAGKQIDEHEFCDKNHLWFVREIDGTRLGIDWTLNHQIWFGATVAAANAAGVKAGAEQVQRFANSLERLMVLRPNGRIRHLARRSPVEELKLALHDRKPEIRVRETKREMAYQTYSLYPLSVLKKSGVATPFWRSRKLQRAMAYVERADHRQVVETEQFVDPYIPAGFPLSYAERAFADQALGENDKVKQSRLIRKQMAFNYDWDTALMTRRSIDPVTQAARFYEVTRLEDVSFERSDEWPGEDIQ